MHQRIHGDEPYGAADGTSAGAARAVTPTQHTLAGVRSRRLRLTVAHFVILIVLATGVLIGIFAYTLDRNAHRSALEQTTAQLGSAAHVAASAFGEARSNLRVQAGQLATSLPLQRAVLRSNGLELERLAAAHHARIAIGTRTFGTLAPPPRITTSVDISNGRRNLARVIVALPIDNALLALVRQVTPLPNHAAIMLTQDGRVIAGGPDRAPAQIRNGRLLFDGTPFVAQEAPVHFGGTSVLVVEPIAAINSISAQYRRTVILAAMLTFALAAGLATRLSRPIQRILGDVARLKGEADTDPLTGLANRRVLSERLDAELARAAREKTSVALVISDLDNFKELNDTYGHQAGDQVLREVARVIAGSLREGDVAARYGGEEFVIVLPGARLLSGSHTADRIREAIANLVVTTASREAVRVTGSFGVAEYPTYHSVEELIEAADVALYEAKRDGKNRVAKATAQDKRTASEAAPTVAAAVRAPGVATSR